MKSAQSIRFALAILLALVVLMGALGDPASATTDNAANGAYRPGTVLVAYKQGSTTASMASALNSVEAEAAGSIYGSGTQVLSVPEGQELQASEALNQHPDILYAEPDYLYHAFVTPNDPSLNQQWSHARVHSQAAWDITTGLSDIIIAIVDSGVDENHPDLASKLVSGRSFLNAGRQDSTPHDLNGHGTHVAGIAAAVTDNGQGVAGMSWGARIMPIRVLNEDGAGYTSDIAAGINWARVNGADIVNLSLGGDNYSATLQQAITDAHDEGILVVAAMGNDGNSVVKYPAACDYVLAVSATDQNDGRASYSSYGPHVDLAAPGGAMAGLHDPKGILSTMPTYSVYLNTKGYAQNYDFLQGTSQAAPHVSGLAALIWSVNPDLSPDGVQTLLQDTAIDLGASGFDPYFGHGRIDAAEALAAQGLATPNLAPIDNPVSDDDFLVDWSDVPAAVRYELQEADNNAFSSPRVYGDLSESRYQIHDQSPGVWYYRVRALSGGIESAWSNIQSTGVLPDTPAISSILSTGVPDAYRLSWGSVPGTQGYQLEESSDDAFTDPVVRYDGPRTVYEVTGQRPGRWYYRLRTYYDEVGYSPWSNYPQAIDVVTPLIPTPTLQPISLSDDKSYTIMWAAVPTATAYTLEQSSSPYFEAPTVAYYGDMTQTTVTDPLAGTWYYRVRAHTSDGDSPWSNTESVEILVDVFIPMVLNAFTTSARLENGDFEQGPTDWTQFSAQGADLIFDRDTLFQPDGPQIEPNSGTWLAWLGGLDDEVSYIEQDVRVGSADHQLAYWQWIASKDSTCGTDVATVFVEDTEVESYDLCEPTATRGWQNHVIDLHAYRGTTVTLRMMVETDDRSNTYSNLFLDDVSFQSTAAAQAVPEAASVPAGVDASKPGR